MTKSAGSAKTFIAEWQKIPSNDAQTTTTTTTRQQAATTFQQNPVNGVSAQPTQSQQITSTVRTQVAKVTYHSADAHSATQNVLATRTMIKKLKAETTAPKSGDRAEHAEAAERMVQEEFARKKVERDQEIMDIKSMLDEMSRTQQQQQQSKQQQVSQQQQQVSQQQQQVSQQQVSQEQQQESKPQEQELPEFHLDLPRTATTATRRSTARSMPAAVRSKSSQPSATKSHELLPDGAASGGHKKRSYNPEEARRFMEEQKLKRRSKSQQLLGQPLSGQKTAYEKELIKKRLEELQKNTRQILHKNVEKKLKGQSNTARSVIGATKKVEENKLTGRRAVAGNLAEKKDERFEGVAEVAPRKDDHVSGAQHSALTRSNDLKVSGDQLQQQQQELHSQQQLEQQQTQSQPTQKQPQLNTQQQQSRTQQQQSQHPPQPHHPLMENQKRVGLLRKPDLKDHSFSAIREFSFDKENVALEMLTPKLTFPLRAPPSDNHKDTESMKSHAILIVGDQDSERKKFDLEVPNVRLTTASMAVAEKSTQLHDNPSLNGREEDTTRGNGNNKPQERCELPFWLKPSAVQVYPYNFIMAVRRKLEAVTNAQQNPQHARDVATGTCNNQTTSTRELRESEMSLKRKDRGAIGVESEGNVKRRIIEEYLKHREEKDQSLRTHTIVNPTNRQVAAVTEAPSPPMGSSSEHMNKSEDISMKTQTYSELNSNLSSISVQLPPSNTVSEVSSIKTDMGGKSRTKSVSRRTQRRHEDDTTTASSSIMNSPEKKPKEDFKFVAPRPVSPLSLERIDNLKISSKSAAKVRELAKPHQNDGDIDFTKLLDDFNRSLSQVIQVNEQLKSTLDKSHQIFSPRSTGRKHSEQTTKTSRSAEYTSDFEEVSTSKEIDVVKERAEVMAKSLERRRRNLFEMANVVKPLLTSPPSEQPAQREENANTAFELKLSSVSASSTTPSKSIEEYTEEINEDEDDDKLKHEADENCKVESEQEAEPEEFEQRLLLIEHMKASLAKAIQKSRANRSGSESKSEKSVQFDEEQLAKAQRMKEAKEKQSGENNTQIEKDLPNSALEQSVTESVTTTTVHNENASPNVQSKTFLVKSIESSPQSVAAASETATSKSISEELQNHHESASVENETEATIPTPTTLSKRERDQSYIKSHINTSRRDYQLEELSQNTEAPNITEEFQRDDGKHQSDGTATAKTSSAGVSPKKSSRSPEMASSLHQSDLDFSIFSSNNDNISESSLSYSNVGLYEKLIRNETSKTEQLTALLKMREKALLDRTKGQIALLQLQKERYKAKGLVAQMAAVKKKQRAILLKMEREREELKRLLQSTSTTTSTESSNRSNQKVRSATNASPKRQRNRSPQPVALLPPPIQNPRTLRNFTQRAVAQEPAAPQPLSTGEEQQQCIEVVKKTTIAPIVRATYALETSRPLEELLQKREADLRQRRAHVERLMQWHQRLDQEEAEVLQLEQMLLHYNNTARNNEPPQSNAAHEASSPGTPKSTTSAKELTTLTPKQLQLSERELSPQEKRVAKMERRLKEIDRSLRELSSITNSSSSPGTTTGEVTAASTGPTASNSPDAGEPPSPQDFVRTSGSKLNKLWRRLTSQQVEKFEPNQRYKLGKCDLERLYEEAKVAVLQDFAQNEERLAAELLEKSSTNLSQCTDSSSRVEHVNSVRVPHLNLSHSSGQSDEADEAKSETNSMAQGNYSPSAAEEDFNLRSHSKSSSECDVAEDPDKFARNMQTFAVLSQRLAAEGNDRLHRSLSDPMLTQLPITLFTATSNQNVYNGQRGHRASDAGTNTMESVQSLHTEATLTGVTDESSNIPSTQFEGSCGVSPPTMPSEAVSSKTESGSTTQCSPPPSIVREEAQTMTSPNASPTLVHASEVKEEVAVEEAQEWPRSVEQTSSKQSQSRAMEISERLQEISSALGELSLANSIPLSYQQSKSCTRVGKEPSGLSTSAKTSKEDVEVELDTSYSCNFENVSTEMQSPSSCTLKNSSSRLVDAEVVASGTNTPDNQPSKSEEVLTLEQSAVNSLESRKQSEVGFLNPYGADVECHSHGSSSSPNTTTCIDDLSLPTFDSSLETTHNGSGLEAQENEEAAARQLITQILDAAEVKGTFATQPAPSPPPPPPPLPQAPTSPAMSADTPRPTATTITATTTTTTTNNANAQLMPDILNELEIRRCQQIILDNEQLKQYEHVTAVPYIPYMREIPNKPPPPYVPPAHGSPMTTIFPSEERIKDITYRRSHELFCELLKTDYTNAKGEKLPSVMEEKITNIYERIILDICREYLAEHEEVLSQGDPGNFHSQLAFFNPPDRVRCVQESIYKEVRRCLAMDKTSPKRSHVYSVYGQRAKRDHIGKIIIQEMYDEDERWCNFFREEHEVLDLIIEEMVASNVEEIAREVFVAEGGVIELELEATHDQEEVEEVIEEIPEQIEEEASSTGEEEANGQAGKRKEETSDSKEVQKRRDEEIPEEDELRQGEPEKETPAMEQVQRKPASKSQVEDDLLVEKSKQNIVVEAKQHAVVPDCVHNGTESKVHLFLGVGISLAEELRIANEALATKEQQNS